MAALYKKYPGFSPIPPPGGPSKYHLMDARGRRKVARQADRHVRGEGYPASDWLKLSILFQLIPNQTSPAQKPVEGASKDACLKQVWSFSDMAQYAHYLRSYCQTGLS